MSIASEMSKMAGSKRPGLAEKAAPLVSPKPEPKAIEREESGKPPGMTLECRPDGTCVLDGAEHEDLASALAAIAKQHGGEDLEGVKQRFNELLEGGEEPEAPEGSTSEGLL